MMIVQLLSEQKTASIGGWKSVTDLAQLAGGSVLKIMEAADENVGTLTPFEVVGHSLFQKIQYICVI